MHPFPALQFLPGARREHNPARSFSWIRVHRKPPDACLQSCSRICQYNPRTKPARRASAEYAHLFQVVRRLEGDLKRAPHKRHTISATVMGKEASTYPSDLPSRHSSRTSGHPLGVFANAPSNHPRVRKSTSGASTSAPRSVARHKPSYSVVVTRSIWAASQA